MLLCVTAYLLAAGAIVGAQIGARPSMWVWHGTIIRLLAVGLAIIGVQVSLSGLTKFSP